MQAKNRRLARADFAKRPLRKVPYLYGAVTLLSRTGGKAAVVVSKKIAPHATTRNTLRRRTYAALHAIEQDNDTLQSATIIMYPNKAALTAPFAEYKHALLRALLHLTRGA